MEMEKNTKLRSVLRGQFTKKIKAFETLMAASDEDSIAITATYKAIKEIYGVLLKLDEKIAESLMTGESIDDAIITKEFEDTEKYKNQWFVIDTKFDFHKKTSTSTTTTATVENRQRIKLPKLEIPKFGGELEQWLPFWAQFKKIHEDLNLTSEDKFVYLFQSISENTEARQLVESYPISEGNYSKCVEHLKQRYAREDLQTQLYVRKLLSVIINKDMNCSLTALYDKISAQLRSLETLGVTKKNAAFILPMVESALPEENLKAWQRSRTHNNNIETELNNLLEFLRIEVNNEQRLKMANANTIFKEVDTQKVPSTAECLVSVENKAQNGCIWCNKTNHSSIECYKIYKMSIEERKRTLNDKRACTICLKEGHFYKQCKTSIKCLICGKRHSTVICMSTKPEPKEQKSSVKSTTSTASTSNHTDSCTLLQTVVVEIEHNGRKMPVRTLYDSGSQRTYIKDQIAKALHLPVEREEVLTHSLFGGTQTNSKTYQAYNFKINSLDNTYSTEIIALGQNVICNNVPKLSSNSCLNTIWKAHDIKLTDNNNYTNEIGLLIGADYSGLFMMNQIIHLQQTGLVAIRTKLGCISANVNNITTTLFCSNLNNDLTGYWSLETLGIQDPAEIKAKEVEANEIMASFEESIKRNDDNRYEVRLPFKSGYEELLPNYNIARKRLVSTTNKIVSSGKFQQYHDIFQEWQDSGIIEQVPDSDIEYDKGHYLPHRAVVKESSLTSKLRPVFDASARDKNNLSLNACLEKGINMIDLIPNLLIGFRTGAIGVSADIQQAFLQINICPIDRNYLKFLWWEDDSLQKVITYRHCRVVFGLTSSPFLLAATLMHHLKGYSSPRAEILKRSWYVDNCITSLDTEEDTLKFIDESKQIMGEAKFNLRMWVTSPLKINEAGKDVISVLGLNWDTATDKLYCNPGYLPNPTDVQNITKRELLSITQKIWDPIGYTAPVMLIPKLILQQTWQKELQWDDPLPSEQLKNFKDWYQEITYLNECQIPRRLTADKIKESKLSLHLFCDASKNGYAAGVVLRAEKNNKVTAQLILAKARVTPPKNISIPRLELLAALIGSRLLAQIKENVNFKECPTYCWTDSSVVLCWIKRQLILNNFVGNRIKEIRKHTEMNDWRHISGTENWMDLASRGCTAKTLYETRWWEGPAWLHQAPEQWPYSEVVVDEREVLAETRKTICNLQVSSYNCLLDKLQNYFSKYSKIVRTVAWILRYIHNLRHANNKKKGELTYKEYERAERKVTQLIQERSHECIDKDAKNLTKYKDENGLIRIKTKLTLSDFPEETRAPYLLPAKHPVVKLMVRQRHEQLQHVGSDQLIVDLRTKFWIMGIRRVVKSVISSCIVCRRYSAKPEQAAAAPLPRERLISSAPFKTCGVDLAGPLNLRNGEKIWIVLYTCAVYRAVHLEATRSLSTEAFIMTLRRFIARRGRIDLLISDQGMNFQCTKSLLYALDWEEVHRVSTVRRIHWKMNAPTAAWWGGFFERLIKIMKELLRKIIGKASLTYDELETILCECEAVMNGRPLTYINDDKNTCLEPLTPAHFLLPANQPTTEVSDLDQIDSNSLNNRLKFIQNIREQFKERFKAEYLTLLIQKGHDGLNSKLDVPVEQLEKLKNAESGGSDTSSTHMEYHRLDAVQANGELVSRLEEHGTADAVGGEKPRVHAQAQLDVPSEDVHRVLVQDGSHVSVHDVTAPTTVASEETTPKIFHGAARLVQPGSSTNNNPLNTHTAIRRAFNNNFSKQTKNTIDRFGAYTAGIPYSPMDMAEYVFWTGDERGVTAVIEDFLLEGMMTKEEAINFLQEIKFNIDFLRAHYTQNLKAAEESTQQEKLRNMLIEQANAGEYQYRNPGLQSLQIGNNPELMRSLVFKNWDMNNNLSPITSLPVTSERRPEPFKRTFDPRLQMNYNMGASDYERDGQMNAEEEYDEIMERLKPADALYPEYTLEIIYQLAKMMFSQSLFQDPAAARAATQQFMTFLELEAEKGQMSRSIEKKVLDVMIAALTDTIADHPDLLQSHDTFTIPTNRRMSPYFKPSPSEPAMSRAVLAAFKDELLKGLTQRKFSYGERN